MNFDNIFSKIESNADKIGGLVGFTLGTPHGLADLESSISNAMQGTIHMPDLAQALGSYASEPYGKTGIMAAIGGYILKEVDLDPRLNKLGSALQKLGIGYAIGALGIKLLWSSTHSGEWRGSGSGLKSSGKNPFEGKYGAM